MVDGIYEITIEKGSTAEHVKTMAHVNGLVVPISGRAKYVVNGKSYMLKKGRILHAGPSMELSKYVGKAQNWKYYLIHYKIIDAGQAGAYLDTQHFDLELNDLQFDEILSLCKQMSEYMNKKKLNSLLKLKSLIYELFYLILDALKDSSLMNDKELIENVKEFIYSNLNKNLSIYNISCKVNMSPKRFTYYFTKVTGISPKKYINYCKVSKAKRLLITTDDNLNNIADEIGYHDVFYFSRFFKKQTGYAPSEFRRRLGK